MSTRHGFLFNGSAIGSGHSSEQDYDDSDYEDDETPMRYDASFQSSSNVSSAAAAAASAAPVVPIFGDSSKLQRGVALPTLGAQQRPNSAEDIRDLTMRSELQSEFWEDVDKMLHRRPPSWKHFSSSKQLPKMRNKLRAAKLAQHKRVTGPPRHSFSTGSKGLDTKLLAEAQQYVARTCAQQKINSSKLLHSEPTRRGKSKSTKSSKRNGAGKKPKSKKYRKKPSSAPSSRSSINRRLAYSLKRSASSKAAKAGKKIDIQALIENFQNGSTLQKLKRQLAKSKQSKSQSEKFITSAKAEWLD